ncbi:MAG TPA: DUF1549 and DUF1553 domain-containing protein [Urbifossiella sp.]|nr:DUF1549 and DUF1553 domain-containing protein [Urbifossiella sp.]
MIRFATATLAALALICTLLRGAEPGYDDPPITAADRTHWSFKTPLRPKLPTVKNARWIKTPIDAFILARLEAAGLAPSPEADRLTLIRRVTLDLTGLPPTPAEVEDFVNDAKPDAYERLVDRLLESPRFGERQATHWLDVVRFAETNGYEADGERLQAWRYRDYVIRSFNDDKPYDRFLTEQIAGDELAAGKPPRDAAELWIATGLHRCGPVHMVGGNLEREVIRQELLTEIVAGIGSSVLGLTIGCARCHDHKFDPISQGDFYRLQAFFSASHYTDVDIAAPEEKKANKKRVEEIEAKTEPLRKAISALDTPVRAKLSKAKRDALDDKYKQAMAIPSEKRTPEQKRIVLDASPLLVVRWDEILGAMSWADRVQRAFLRDRLHDWQAKLPPPPPAAWAIKNTDPAQTFVFKRGNPKQKLSPVNAAFPRVLAAAEAQPKSRIELARWITRPEHPLTARVMVNRLWQHHFGKGIVATPNDFGIRGERPTHPELLDWLACELTQPASGKPWALKRIHRLMVLSNTYRQSVGRAPASGTGRPPKVDPANKLLGRMNRQRLEAEAIRDSILAAAGSLNVDMGGPSVRVPLEPAVYDLIFTEGEPDGLWPVTPDVRQHSRRSIYLFNKRNVRLPLFEAFDQPDTLNTCAVRPVSTFAPQALILMNGPFAQAQGKALALRLVREVGSDPARQIEALYRRTLGRKPSAKESQLAREFLKDQTATIREEVSRGQPLGLAIEKLPKDSDLAAVRALADLCVVAFNGNEFVYRP